MSGEKSGAPTKRPSLKVMLSRAVLRRCPRCGDWRAWFRPGLRGWLSHGTHCHTCGLHWDRDTPGHELGGHAFNIVIVGGLLTIGIAVGIAVTWPDIKVVPILMILGPIALIGPIVGYPLGYTVWMAVDLRIRPPERAELERMKASLDEDAARARPK